MKILFNKLGILFFIILISPILTPACFAQTIKITGPAIIDKPTSYKNVTLDLNKGSFVITAKATLELENVTINGTVSPQNPFLIQLTNGKLMLKNSVLNVTVTGIQETPLNPSLFYALVISKGKVEIIGNRFTIDTPYTVGLLTTQNFQTTNFIITNNKIYNFHGAFFLSNSNNALVSDNFFSQVSLSNILTKNGSNNIFQHNIMLLSGNNGVDILDSSQITFSENHIFSSSCYSIFILRSHDVLVEHNQVTGGKTYAIYIAPSIGSGGAYTAHLASLVSDSAKNLTYKNSGITIINNYLAQNRFGLSAINVDGMEVHNNIFIQRFSNNKQRKFWTNNDILLSDTIHLIWSNNLYKEAFPQVISEPIEKSLKLVEFPAHGGATL